MPNRFGDSDLQEAPSVNRFGDSAVAAQTNRFGDSVAPVIIDRGASEISTPPDYDQNGATQEAPQDAPYDPDAIANHNR